ncbi:hypothetical protein [Stieleria varia]|nr:hypothetical protein [Stieleria varia]
MPSEPVPPESAPLEVASLASSSEWASVPGHDLSDDNLFGKSFEPLFDSNANSPAAFPDPLAATFPEVSASAFPMAPAATFPVPQVQPEPAQPSPGKEDAQQKQRLAPLWLIGSLLGSSLSLIAGLTALLFVLTHPQLGRPQINPILRWNFGVGDHFEVFTKNSDITRNVTLDVSTKSNVSIWERWQVTDVDPAGNATIESAITRMVIEVESPGNVFIFDTNEEDVTSKHETLGANIRPAIGQAVPRTVSPQGEVSNVQPPERLRSLNLIGNLTLEKHATSFMMKTPQGSVSPGDQWQSEEPKEFSGVHITRLNEYTYKGAQQQADKILHAVTSSQKTRIDQVPEGSSLKIVGEDSTGEYLYDLQAGHLVRFTSTASATQVVGENPPTEVNMQTQILMTVEKR